MRNRIRLRRVLSAALAFVICILSLPYSVGAEEILTISPAPQDTAARRAPLAVTLVRQTVETGHEIEFVAKATADEFNSLVLYAAGKNPTENKPIEAEGQNTKRNTATTLIDIFKQTRPVKSFYFQLKPYQNKKGVWEVCAFYTPFFGEKQVVHTGLLHDYNTGIIYRADGTGAVGIGYDFNFAFDTYYASDDPWQRNFGFCPLYDKIAFLIGDYCETIRVPFEYNGKKWMIQIWKGIYSTYMLGGEIGLYNKPLDRETEFYDCAADPDRIQMSFTVYLGDELIVESEHKTTWWQTAFTYHKLARPRDLTLNGKLTLRDTAMAKAFVESLRAQAPDVTVQRIGKEVTFTW